MTDMTLFISSDMRVVSYHNGIKLLLPHDPHFAAATTVATLLQLPMSVYFLDTEGRTVLINAEGAAVCGFDTPMNSRGKSLLDVSEQQSAISLIDNCRAVIQTGKTKIFEEANQRQDGISMQFLSVKMPWYAEPETVIGVMGVSIVLGKHSLSDALSQLKALGLLNQEKPNYCKINDVQLTQRELQCLQATVQGFTAKEIAQQLGISYRTVEEYLNNIREKAGASSKAELVRMVMGQIDLRSIW